MIIEINKPEKYANSFLFNKETGFVFFQEENKFFLAGDASEQQLLDAFAAHNPSEPTEPTVADKLAAAGLTIDELKSALGLS